MQKILEAFTSDHPELVSCKVKGTLPAWLKGTLYRNGPGKYRFGPDEGKHLFDGMAVIHQYIIKDGQVSYRNRFLDSDTYRRNTAANRIVMSEFGVVAHPDPCKSMFTRYFSYLLESGQTTDNTCDNLMLLGNKLYLLTDTPVMNLIDPVTLGRIKKDDWRKYVKIDMCTGHPKRDPDGTTYNIGTHASWNSSYKIIKIIPQRTGDDDPVRKAVVVGSILTQWPRTPCYAHSFGLTPNYIIFIEQPMGVNFFKVATGRVTGKSLLDSMYYYEQYKTKFHVYNKSTGSLVEHQFVAEPFFFLHHINAYEEDDQIVVDICAYKDGNVMKCLTFENIRNQGAVPKPNLTRYVLPVNVSKRRVNLVTLPYTTAKATALDDGTVYCEPESIPDAFIELPGINLTKYSGKKYRYVYGVQTDRYTSNKLIKVDIVKKTLTVWSVRGYFPGEPVFVPDPDGKEEDDGVILSPIISVEKGVSSFLLVLEAKSFTELARAEIPADVIVPLSFHGIFADIH